MGGKPIKGQIRKALSGFYYVHTPDGAIYQTRGRGNFRAKKQSILVGDRVVFESQNDKEGVILSIEERRNELVRPPIANIDRAIIVMAATQPQFSSLLLDRYLVVLESLSIRPLLYISKWDLLEDASDLLPVIAYYRELGYQVITSESKAHLQDLQEAVRGEVSVLMGQSGAGKSTLLNRLLPDLDLETDSISKHLGRGRHTTRHVEIHDVHGCLIADTPGFSAIDFSDLDLVDLETAFIDLHALGESCRFRGCSHTHEPGCQVKEAIEENTGLAQRYKHYLSFYDEIKSRKVIYRNEEKK